MSHQVNDNEALGAVRGHDAVKGELAWAWDLGQPDLKGLPPEGGTNKRGPLNMWTIADDEESGLVYLPLGNSSVDYFDSGKAPTRAIASATALPPKGFKRTAHLDRLSAAATSA